METSELPTGCPGSRFAFPGAAAGRELGGCSTWVPSQKTAAAAGPSPPSVLNRAREPASAAGATSVSSTSSTRKGPTARHDRRRGAGNCCLFSRSQLRSKLLAPCSACILALVRHAWARGSAANAARSSSPGYLIVWCTRAAGEALSLVTHPYRPSSTVQTLAGVGSRQRLHRPGVVL